MTALVVPVRRGDNEELRYALRAAEANIPHEELWIVGSECPRWLRPTGTVVPAEAKSKWHALRRAWEVVAACTIIADDIVWLDDDMFVMAPWSGVPFHLGDAPTNTANRTHTRGLRETYDLLEQLGVEGPFVNYEVHAPFPVNHRRLRAALNLAHDYPARCLHVRTLYGNLYKIPAWQCKDFKLRNAAAPYDRPILSTTDANAFRDWPAGKHIRSSFPNPSRWEAA